MACDIYLLSIPQRLVTSDLQSVISLTDVLAVLFVFGPIHTHTHTHTHYHHQHVGHSISK